jgi:rubrerythrin
MDNLRLRDFVDFAVQREIEAALFYERCAAQSGLAPQKALLSELAAMERGHEQRLGEFQKTGKVDSFARKMPPDLKLSDFMVAEEVSADSPLQDIFIYAMKKEQKAYELYEWLAALEAEDEATKAFFHELAAMEKGHKHDLEIEYEKGIIAEG